MRRLTLLTILCVLAWAWPSSAQIIVTPPASGGSGGGTPASVAETVTTFGPATNVVCTPSATGGDLANGTYHLGIVAWSTDANVGSPVPTFTTCTITGGDGHGSLAVSWTDPAWPPGQAFSWVQIAVGVGHDPTIGDVWWEGDDTNPTTITTLVDAGGWPALPMVWPIGVGELSRDADAVWSSSLRSTAATAVTGVALGYRAGGALATVGGGVAIGENALAHQPADGWGNVAVGDNALALTTGGGNTAVGHLALSMAPTAIGNTVIGTTAMGNATGGNNNVAVGQYALRFNTTGLYNMAVGTEALKANSTGSYNIAIGSLALGANTTGGTNTAVGTGALGANTSGQQNVGIAWSALAANTSGARNVAVGYQALANNTTGVGNVAIGMGASETYNGAYGTVTGNYNTFIGDVAAQGTADVLTNATAIGHAAVVTKSNQVALGDIYVTELKVGTAVSAAGTSTCAGGVASLTVQNGIVTAITCTTEPQLTAAEVVELRAWLALNRTK